MKLSHLKQTQFSTRTILSSILTNQEQMFAPRTGMCGWLHINNISFINTSNLSFCPTYRYDKYIATQDKIMAQGKLIHPLKMYQPAHM